MKRLSKITPIVMVLFSLGTANSMFLSGANAATPPPARALRLVFSKIRQTARVPILLPSRLPMSVNEKKIHFTSGDTTPQGYDISLSSREGCGDACFVGYFEAKRGESINQSDFDKIVRLANGTTGYYRARSCGGSCSPPEIDWVYKGVLYTIQFNVNNKSKSQDEAEMVALANSAILGGER